MGDLRLGLGMGYDILFEKIKLFIMGHALQPIDLIYLYHTHVALGRI